MSDLKDRLRWYFKTFPVTCVVITFCVLVFLLSQTFLSISIDKALSFPSYIDLSQSADLLRLISPVFLHFSLMHIVFNLLLWWIFARQIEYIQSSSVLLGLSISAALCSNGAQFLLIGPNFGGLSGVVYGLGGYLWVWNLMIKPERFLFPPALMPVLVVWMLLGFMGTFDRVLGPMANWAHFGGLMSGIVIGVIGALWVRGRRRGS